MREPWSHGGSPQGAITTRHRERGHVNNQQV